jgi:hypothetical protein
LDLLAWHGSRDLSCKQDIQADIVKLSSVPRNANLRATIAPQALPHQAPYRQRRLLVTRASGVRRARESFDGCDFRLPQGNVFAAEDPACGVHPMSSSSN